MIKHVLAVLYVISLALAITSAIHFIRLNITGLPCQRSPVPIHINFTLLMTLFIYGFLTELVLDTMTALYRVYAHSLRSLHTMHYVTVIVAMIGLTFSAMANQAIQPDSFPLINAVCVQEEKQLFRTVADIFLYCGLGSAVALVLAMRVSAQWMLVAHDRNEAAHLQEHVIHLAQQMKSESA